jgi:hypothetical protein
VIIYCSTVTNAQITAKPYPNLRPRLEDAFWEAKILDLIDPFGNRLLFSEA